MAKMNGKQNGKSPRKNNGKAVVNADNQPSKYTDGGGFLKGNPGRPKGSKNKSPCRIREIRDDIVMSWDRVGANAKLDALAGRDFEAYCRVVIPLMPKITEVETTPMIVINPQIHCETQINFIAHLEAAAVDGSVSPEAVLRLLDQHAKGTLPALPVASS